MISEVLVLFIGLTLGWRFSGRFVERGWNLRTHLSLRDSGPLLGIIGGIAVWLGCFFFLRSHRTFLWIFPEWVELIHLDVIKTGFLLVVSFLSAAVAGVSLRTGGHKVQVGVIVSAVVLGGYMAYAQSLHHPITDSLRDERVDGVILQTSNSSCAAASTANVLNSLGMQTSEREMANLLLTSKNGTVPTQILPVVRKLGYSAERFSLDRNEWESAPVPSVILIDHPAVGREGHAASLMRIEDGCFEVWDPLAGRQLFSRAELARVWHGRGVHIWRKDEGAQK